MSRKQISINLSPIDILYIQKICDETGLSRSIIIRQAIREYIRDYEIKSDERYMYCGSYPYKGESIYEEDIPF